VGIVSYLLVVADPEFRAVGSHIRAAGS